MPESKTSKKIIKVVKAFDKLAEALRELKEEDAKSKDDKEKGK